MKKSSSLHSDFKYPVNIWVGNLTVLSLFKICKLVLQNKGAYIRVLNKNPVAYKALALIIKKFRLYPIKILEVNYSLGDINIGKDSVAMILRFESIEIVNRVFGAIKSRSLYENLIGAVSPDKLEEFFIEKIRIEAHSIIKALYLIHWHKTCNPEKQKNILLCHYTPLLQELRLFRPDNAVDVEAYNKLDYYFQRAKNKIKILIKRKLFHSLIDLSGIERLASGPNFGLTYAEGFDTFKRSDMAWHPKSGIDIDRVIVIFIEQARELNRLKELDLKWVCILKMPKFTLRKLKDFLKDISIFFVSSSYPKMPKFNTRAITVSESSRWIINSAEELFGDVGVWYKLFELLNIKLVYTMGTGTGNFLQSIAQSIALELCGGLRVGMQRSAVFTKKDTNYLRRNPNDLFFIWGNEVLLYGNLTKVIKNFVICGYPYDRIFNSTPVNEILKFKQNGKAKKFIISLFDDAFNKDIWLTKNNVRTFYLKFLNWLIEDDSVVIITKEKSTLLFDQLGIENLVSVAKATNRFIRLGDVNGRFPSDASIGVDMAIGIAPSTPVMESVIVGCRGIHCDIAKHPGQHYYDWGYEKLIFDNTDRLIAALKRYIENPSNEEELGDWSPFIDQVEPFRDGGGGERIGRYMNCLLEAISDGEKISEAIIYANRLYRTRWGDDKVYNITDENNF